MKIGIQLYSVREELKKDFKGTLKALAKMGFHGVELAFFYGGMAPEELKKILDETGLQCIGIYENIANIANPESDAYKYASALKAPSFTTGMTDKVNEKDWPGAIEALVSAAKNAKSKNIGVVYHNHNQEFTKLNGHYALDVLFEKTSSDLIKAELDTAWIVKGGEDPVSYIRKYKGRQPKLHVKDITEDGTVTEIGNGSLNFKEIIEAAKDSGVEWLVYEQDSSSIGAMKSAEISIKALQKLLK